VRTGLLSSLTSDAGHDGFWLLQTRVALAVLLAQIIVVMAYLAATPHGQHRVAIWVIASSCFALGIFSLFAVVPLQSVRTWRVRFSLGWSIATCVVTGLVTALDGRVASPLRSLLVVPVAFAGLVFPPASVAVTAITAILAAVAVSASDPRIGAEWPGLLIDFSVLIGISTISFAASLGRMRLEREADRLTTELAEIATIDELTGCLNRRAFEERCRVEVARATRSGRPLLYVMLDLDDLKRINDTGGHAAGDRALALVGTTLRSMSRATDVVARFGGDEFAMLIPDADVDGVLDLAKRVSKRLAAGGEGPLTLSYGGSVLDGRSSEMLPLREEADRALYEAKNAGRDCIVVHDGLEERTLHLGERLGRPVPKDAKAMCPLVNPVESCG
jgi:diguanylate cyclase (GGDEF)-like protein